MKINEKDQKFIEKIAKDIEEQKLTTSLELILEMVYEMGVKEGKVLVVKNAVEFISK